MTRHIKYWKEKKPIPETKDVRLFRLDHWELLASVLILRINQKTSSNININITKNGHFAIAYLSLPCWEPKSDKPPEGRPGALHSYEYAT